MHASTARPSDRQERNVIYLYNNRVGQRANNLHSRWVDEAAAAEKREKKQHEIVQTKHPFNGYFEIARDSIVAQTVTTTTTDAVHQKAELELVRERCTAAVVVVAPSQVQVYACSRAIDVD